MSSPERAHRRLLWIVNHKALIPAEVPLLREFGYEVFIPKIIPDPASFRSGEVTWEHDAALTLPPAALDVLNAREFHGPDHQGRRWSPTLRHLINTHFDVLITSKSAYIAPPREAVRWFKGRIVARIFGRQIEPIEDPNVLPYLSDDEPIALFAAAPVFIYPCSESRHIHYSPIEAMVVGVPVLYRRGALTDVLAGGPAGRLREHRDHARKGGAPARRQPYPRGGDPHQPGTDCRHLRRKSRAKTMGRGLGPPVTRRRRILWMLNHHTLMPDEVGIVRDLAFAVFTRRLLPRGTAGRSTKAAGKGKVVRPVRPRNPIRCMSSKP